MKIRISIEAENFIQKSKNPLKDRLLENILSIKKDPYHKKYKNIKTKRPLKSPYVGILELYSLLIKKKIH